MFEPMSDLYPERANVSEPADETLKDDVEEELRKCLGG